ncbi:MAG TPA: glycosyltransferase family 39 protein, partial [Chloroflexota bacterium]
MIQAQLARSVLAERRSWITWGGILTLALTLRLALLDLAPLDSIEAGLVLPAWQAAQALPVDLSVGPQSPLFTSLTTLVFWLFGASDVTARLIPALAGAALAVTPALLPPFCGPWARVAAGALLATSPLALELSRRADPASLTILCVALVFGAVLRFGWDRPRWAPWLFAGALGAGLASQGGTVIALILAAVAGFIAGALWSDQEPWQLPMIDYGRARGPALFGVAAAVVAATCGLFDLRGLGFLAGDVWGQAATLLLRPALSGWQLFSLLAYAAPLLALAVLEIVWGIRAKDR